MNTLISVEMIPVYLFVFRETNLLERMIRKLLILVLLGAICFDEDGKLLEMLLCKLNFQYPIPNFVLLDLQIVYIFPIYLMGEGVVKCIFNVDYNVPRACLPNRSSVPAIVQITKACEVTSLKLDAG